MTFGTFIREEREKRKIDGRPLSRWRLSKDAGLGLTQLKKIEQGSPCTIQTAIKLFKALDIKTMDWSVLQGE